MDAMGHVSGAMSQFQNLKQKLLVNTTHIQVPMSKLKENTHILVIPTNNPHMTLQPLITPTKKARRHLLRLEFYTNSMGGFFTQFTFNSPG